MRNGFLLITLLSASICGFSRSFTLRVINNSIHNFFRQSVKANPNPGLCADLSNSNDKKTGHGLFDNWSHLEPGKIGEFKIHDDRFYCGLEGLVEWSYSQDSKIYTIHVDFNIPFVGGNEFFYSATYPFAMKHVGGGDGGNVELTFEISGGPPEPRLTKPLPPPPITLPTSGNKIIKGQFYWNANETGLPKRSDDKKQLLYSLTGAFKIDVMAPTQLRRNSDGGGKDNYKGNSGYFADYKKLANAKISFTDSRDDHPDRTDIAHQPLSPIKIIRFSISGLPEDIPVNIIVNTKNPDWQTGAQTPAKPTGKPDARWLVFIHEKEKTVNLIKYQVFGAWFSGDGGYSSDLATTGIIAQLKRNITTSFFGGMPGDIKIKNTNKTVPVKTPIHKSQHKAFQKNNQ